MNSEIRDELKAKLLPMCEEAFKIQGFPKINLTFRNCESCQSLSRLSEGQKQCFRCFITPFYRAAGFTPGAIDEIVSISCEVIAELEKKYA